ncbi:MAG: DNA alkylation repair protein [Lachnospiraceae bacterium]|nr:DNA alkylation repair protein [Lachnospiraceae bacterium]
MKELTREIQGRLYEMQDKKYADFQGRLIPTVEAGRLIGVRTPQLRKYAKELAGREDITEFLEELPHPYFDENQLHAFIISLEKDYEKCLEKVERFLPYVDNWATCDQMSPKVFARHTDKLLGAIQTWIASEHTYTVRFAIGMLMQHFLDEQFTDLYPEMVAGVHSEEYYINMMSAWYFATGLAKQYDRILPYLTGHRLDTWVHNKTIQKAVESYRITPEQKAYLRTLKYQ